MEAKVREESGRWRNMVRVWRKGWRRVKVLGHLSKKLEANQPIKRQLYSGPITFFYLTALMVRTLIVCSALLPVS